MSGMKLREYLNKRMAEAPTQVTEAIKPIRLQPVTGPVPAVEPPARQVLHIVSVHPSLFHILPVSRGILLSACRMAYEQKIIPLRDGSYRIEQVWEDPGSPGKIMAQLERM